MFSEFEDIRIINLPQRLDRRREMSLELRRLGLSSCDRVRFFDAMRPDSPGPFASIGARGAFESHMEILRQAVERNHSVLIIEDDCDFISGAERYQVPRGTDVFYGGYEALGDKNLHESDIIGAHLMGFSAEACRIALEFVARMTYCGKHPPIDGLYVWIRRAHPELKTHFAVPALGHQRPSPTDIAARHPLDSVAAARPVLAGARRVKRALQRLGRARIVT